MGKEVLVSIDCLTYNHGNYIAEAIEGFLMQKTDFAFEILIHEDASTDNTAEVIREYEKNFPHIIKPIYQRENQYSKGVDVDHFNAVRAKGKYIALCEGDDYWTDPFKLQKQVDYLEANPNCSLCVHAASRFSDRSKEVVSKVRPSRKNKIFTAEEVISGGGGLFPSNSMVYRHKFTDTYPESYTAAGIGDYPLAIHLADNGDIYYMDEVMSVYRVDVNGSWTEKMESDINNAALQNKELDNLLDIINRHTNFRYAKTIEQTKKKNSFEILVRQRKLKEAFRLEYRKFYLNGNFIRKSFSFFLMSFQKKFVKI